MTMKGSIYCSIYMLKRYSAAKVRKVWSKLAPKMAVFLEYKGLNIKYTDRDPHKALPYPERRFLTYFA